MKRIMKELKEGKGRLEMFFFFKKTIKMFKNNNKLGKEQ